MRVGVAALVLLTLAGCRSTHAHALPSGAVVLRTLPPQGLIDEERRGVALRDLLGRRLVWLPGFAVRPRSPSAQASPEYGFLATGIDPPLLHGPHGWYRLDATRHALIPVTGGRVPLAGGATVVVGRGPAFTLERDGRVILRVSSPFFRLLEPDFAILSPRLVQAGRRLLDVVTGRRWKLPPGCLAAGVRGEAVILACGVAHAAEGVSPLVLKRIVPGVKAHPLTQALAELIPEAASLSPDRNWVAVEGFTGCAASYVYVAPARGGAARIVYGRSIKNPFAANYSSLLGWSADGRLVVRFIPPYCDEPYGPQHPPRGVYLVDPRTLARTFVARNADAMWNPTPGRR
jgi:hypothetical protein